MQEKLKNERSRSRPGFTFSESNNYIVGPTIYCSIYCLLVSLEGINPKNSEKNYALVQEMEVKFKISYLKKKCGH